MEAQRMARGLMAEHGLKRWTLVLDRAKTRAGVCRAGRREIGLSRELTALHSVEQVRDTVLHEIAHALVGPGHGHDAVWRATAVRIGGSGERCVPSDAPKVEGPWVGVCPAGHRMSVHRRPVRVRTCPTCSPTLDLDALYTWTLRGQPAPMHPAYVAELAHVRAAARHGGSGARVGAPGGAVDLEPGERVRLLGGGKYAGLVGVIEKRGRTRYAVRTPRGLVSAPFTLVGRLAEPSRAPGSVT
ncbi:SprT-like domain-containing protein [Cellulomonas cellasea]|uniref:SprT-like domain-containing protein n=1 Tax=Cellulomonas cellasea TaxID=43670 RepID=UPI0025A3603B|nr:SprT-like domain-containing protein [Cellulomonas cellasea]MDM8083739.1 SprT-like domain-containing protein [Cellulomonas cellasea]